MKHSNLYLGLVLPSGGWSLTVENFEQLRCVQGIRIIKVKLDYDDVYVRVKRNYGLTKLGMTANNPQHASLFNYF
jgi:hypothetical protein